MHHSTASFMARLPIPYNSILTTKTYILPIDVPFKTVIDVLQQFVLSIDFFSKHITSQSHNWHIALQLQHCHAYILHEQLLFSTCYSEPKILKMHKHFMHPSPEKLFHLIRRAKTEQSNPQIIKLLQYIYATSEACVLYSAPAFRLHRTISRADSIFNKDLPWIWFPSTKNPS